MQDNSAEQNMRWHARLVRKLQSRQFRSGGYAASYVLVFAAILVAANWLAVQYNETYDSTGQKLYSLSDQTHRILDNLDREVTVMYFDRTSQFEGAQDLLRRYENASGRVAVEYVDPDEDPIKTEAMNVRSYGTVMLMIGGVRHEATSLTEQDITNAIIMALKGQDRVACVVTGHGEMAGDDRERNGLAAAVERMEGANYEHRDVNLVSGAVPEDCTLLLVAGPATAYFEPEVAAIRSFVEGGGRLLLLLGAVLPDAMGRRDDTNPELVELVAGWGIDFRNDVVIDESAIGQLFGGGPFAPLVSEYGFHAIVEPMENIATLFPRARSVTAADDPPETWEVDELFESSDASFSTSSLQAEEGAFTLGPESAQTDGPIPLAVAATYDVPDPEPEASGQDAEGADAVEDEGDVEEVPADPEEQRQGRVVAVGSAGFASNYGLGLGGNEDLLLNMLNWLSSDEDLISVRPKDPESTPIEMTAAEMSRIWYGSLMLLPLVIIITGVWTWWGRR